MKTPDIPSDLIIENTSQGFWMIDASTFQTLKVNGALCALLGYPREAFDAKGPMDFVAEHSRPVLHQQFTRIPTRNQRNYELAFLHKDGHEIFCRLNATTVMDEDGIPQVSFAFINDITKEHLAEQALHEREHMYRQMFISNTAVKLLIDPVSGDIHDANPAAEAFYGYSLKELKGLKISDINTLPPERIQQEMERAKSEQRLYFLFKHRLKSGEIRDVEVYSGPATVHGKTMLHSIIHDITDRVRSQETLEAQAAEIALQKDRAELADRAKSDFLAQMSHELRTPLNSILGFSELMRMRLQGSLNDTYAEYADLIHGSGQHLLSIINNLLDLSKIESGHIEMQIDRIAPRALIIEALAMTQDMAKEHNITIATDIPDNLPDINADEQRLRQILLNLLSNAIKFTPAQGHVHVSAHNGGGELHLRIEDNGIGMNEDEVAIALSPFGQVDGNPLVRNFEGTGLGLPLVSQLIEMHHGRMHIDSAPNIGTTVTVSLPLTHPH